MEADKERFISIIKANRRILYKIIYSYCKDPEDRRDLEQEILINIWRSLKTYNERYTLSTWIYRVALNVSISFYRKDLTRKAHTKEIDENILQLEDSNNANENDDNLNLLNEFIDELDEFNKAIMILLLEGNSYKSIAEIIGISETNVATKINRIKKDLKRKFITIEK